MNEIAKKLAGICVKNKLVAPEMFEWCVYSIEKKMVTFCTWVVLISIGAHLFGFPCTLCFTLGFLVLRRRTNGYHAKTYIRCLIGSILIECSSIFAVRNAPMEWLIGSFPFTIMEIVMCNSHTPPALPSSTKKGRRNMKRRLIEYQSSPGSQNLVRRRLLSCTPTLWRSLRLRCSVVGGLAYVL